MSRTGAIAGEPTLTLELDVVALTTAGDDYVIATMDHVLTGDTGEQQLALQRIGPAGFRTVTVESTPITKTTEDGCFGYIDTDGCQASGPSGARTLVLVGLAFGLLAFRRRPRAS